MRVFIDSDVVISSLLSSKGAASLLIHTSSVTKYISDSSWKELETVCARMNISHQSLHRLIDNECAVVDIAVPLKQFEGYVLDTGGAHILAGAVVARASYLISYNQRHFKKDRIKETFDIIVLTPAMFLQYLRNQ